MSVLDIAKARSSVRAYTEQEVEEDMWLRQLQTGSRYGWWL